MIELSALVLTVLSLLTMALAAILYYHLLCSRRERERKDDSLLKVASIINSTQPLDDVLENIASQLVETFDVDQSVIFLFDRGGKSVSVAAKYSRDDASRVDVTGGAFPPQARRIIEEMISDSEPMVIPNLNEKPAAAEMLETLRLRNVHALLIIPLVSGEDVVGCMTLSTRNQRRRFGADEVRLSKTIANQIVTTIEKARLYEQEQRRARQASLLNVVARQANTILTPERLLPAVAAAINRAFDYDSIIMLLDPRRQELRIAGKAGAEAERIPDHFRQSADEGVIGWVAQHGDTFVVNDTRAEERYFEPFPNRYQAGSELAVPLKIDGETVGVLDLQSQEEGSFDNLTVATAETLAEQIAIALKNARLYDEAQRRGVQLKAAIEVARDTTAILDVDELLTQTVHLISDRFRFYYAGAFLLDEERQYASLHAASSKEGERMLDRGYKLTVGEGSLVGYVADTGVAQIASDVGQHAAFLPYPDLPDTQSQMALPLVSRGDVIGVLDVQSTRTAAFGDEDSAVLQAMADQLANAIESARLYEAARQRVAELEAVRQAGLHVTSSLELQPVLEAILESVLQLVSGSDAHVFLYDGHTLSFGAAMWAGVAQGTPFAEPRPDGLTYNVARSGERVVAADVKNHSLFQDGKYDAWAGAIVGLPLKIGDEVKGVMNVAFEEPHAFSEYELDVLELLGDQAAIAIENARLYKDSQRHIEELRALHDIDVAITSTLSLDEVLRQVHELLSKVMKLDTFYIGIYDQGKNLLQLPIIVDQGRHLAPIDLDLEDEGGFAGWVIRNRKSLWIDDWEEERDALPVDPIARGTPTRSLMVLPLIARAQIVGVISAQSEEPHAFDEGHRRLFSGIAHQVAVGLENARLFEEVERRLNETRLLQRIMGAASSTLDFDQVLARTIDILHDTLGIEYLSFALPEPDGSGMIVHASMAGFPAPPGDHWHLPMNGSVMGQVYKTGEPLLLPDVQEAPWYFEASPSTRSELAVPVRVGDEVVAVLNAESSVPRGFDEDDLSLFSAVAGQLGVVLDNARLFEQTSRRLAETRLLRQVMQAASSSLDFDEVLERTIEALHGMLGIQHLSFSVPDEEGTSLRVHPSQIGYPPEVVERRIPVEDSVSGQVYRTGEPQMIPDVRQTPYYFQGASEVLSELNVPVRVAGRVIAVLNAESPQLDAFDEDDLRLFQAVAAQLGVVLENAHLYQKLQEQRDKLRKAYEELKEIDRLRTELVQNVSHELRTPFSLVQGYIELMLAGDLGPLLQEQRAALQVMRTRVQTLRRLIYDLTALDRIPRRGTKLMPTSIVNPLEAALKAFEVDAERASIELQRELAENVPLVLADEEQLTRAFRHLIDNAIKFSPGGGTVVVRAWADDGQSCISITDPGIGIAPAHLDHIFERFYQADGSINRRFGGMGVGLALVWEIVEAHGGNVDVESTEQEGSTFIVALPQLETADLGDREQVADQELMD